MKEGRVVFAVLLLFGAAMIVSAQDKTVTANAGQLNRGRYLVEQVGMCADCHTPRNQRGEFIKEKWLAGAPLDFAPSVPIPGWVGVAPGIAGLPGWNEQDAIQYMSTGKSMNGRTTGPPMPRYRLARADAAAVVAYLKSLQPKSAAQKSVEPK